MDPAVGVFSPFHSVLDGKNSRINQALELATKVTVKEEPDTENGGGKAAIIKTPKENGSNPNGTLCGGCEKVYTTKKIPKGGTYLCKQCGERYISKSAAGHFPPNTLKCCPASVTEGTDGVVRCCACHSWYHCACLGIVDKTLKEYISLSTTKWYCMEPACCEKVLCEKLKRKR
ncbi:uncharacterized protein TEOVI_000221100 [Trypanosoma equiperdum]|uniref:PHD-type domain-containing protein n=4 Tax=Trypanozoon TaxID=39700 RepID=Q582U8_TRYB2|nr:hypothetical protein, conserved [Trypanosoma brucei gambiense DAL972]XP_843829.1 hypothetical protein, conserved [Trypanosoma brucei brucei TREU927]AAX80684.1 hypothetical protein, conserved [Trypanosoma brucei]RHW73861.1 hypothetical protein DPX39_030022500 [Trypanosoma brucei equiperdum]SCU70637.1 hypothetical protein, conserved [Trypanosoma equiperdum]AAZ10270.1 hypothetical protein, conserved [Trypanosoma brucei brucei TREU927]CBH09895.1 hypothetical protein, conserved [Trypanosoma bru|eukprot:XP_011772188.1 hypothetical protein, conserved [Trypanosoma brucei gambiense DAL972]